MFSIIVCSHRPERADFIRRHYESLFRDCDFEFILIEDAASLCEGYTRGISQSHGEYLLFSHDDIEFVTPDVPTRISTHLETYDAVGIAGTKRLIDGSWLSSGDPYCFGLVIYPEERDTFSVLFGGSLPLCAPDIQALDGCFIACRRAVAMEIGFDVETFDGFHLYDLDFTFRAYLAGKKLAVCRDLALIHASKGNRDEAWNEYRLRFEAKHRAHLATGLPAEIRMLSTVVSRNQLQGLCDPANLVAALQWE